MDGMPTAAGTRAEGSSSQRSDCTAHRMANLGKRFTALFEDCLAESGVRNVIIVMEQQNGVVLAGSSSAWAPFIHSPEGVRSMDMNAIVAKENTRTQNLFNDLSALLTAVGRQSLRSFLGAAGFTAIQKNVIAAMDQDDTGELHSGGAAGGYHGAEAPAMQEGSRQSNIWGPGIKALQQYAGKIIRLGSRSVAHQVGGKYTSRDFDAARLIVSDTSWIHSESPRQPGDMGNPADDYLSFRSLMLTPLKTMEIPHLVASVGLLFETVHPGVCHFNLDSASLCRASSCYSLHAFQAIFNNSHRLPPKRKLFKICGTKSPPLLGL
jgi:hypothetical protein